MCPSFPFGFEGRIWDVIVLIPDHCLSIYFVRRTPSAIGWYSEINILFYSFVIVKVHPVFVEMKSGYTKLYQRRLSRRKLFIL